MNDAIIYMSDTVFLHKLYFNICQLLIYDIRLYRRVKQIVLCNDKDIAESATRLR